MKISWANRRTAKRWQNREVTWAELTDMLRTPVRTKESAQEFAGMTRNQQDAIKDVGGFVGGHLRLGTRRSGNVTGRSMLTLDADFATTDFWDNITLMYGWRCCVYSTHKHTPKSPRLRLVIPLSRDISEAEYPAVARMVARDIGIDMFDDTTYEPCRLMYWPSASKKAEFIFEEQDGEPLNPDEYLTRYDDWRDVTQWPVSSRQSESVKFHMCGIKRADPRECFGVVGAFNRVFDVADAIAEFLPDVYEPNAIRSERYDYKPGKAEAGLTIYDGGLYAYSHHDSDPAHGRALNAFDLVRVHLFPDDNEKKSNTSMTTFALGIDRVKAELSKPKDSPTASDDFGDLPDDDAPDDYDDLLGEAEVNRKAEKPKEKPKSGKIILDIDRKGNVINRTANFVKIIENAPAFQNVKYNAFTRNYEIHGDIPWKREKGAYWTEADDQHAQKYIEQNYEIWGYDKFHAAFVSVTQNLRSFHPLKDYLENLKWDGVPRLDTLLIDSLGAEDTPYVRAVTRKTLIAAAARIYKPGIKFDTLLVLNGPQGIGKSQLFECLAGKWYSDSLSLNDIRDLKAAPEKLQGFWIVEIGELSGIRKVDVESMKAFLSRQDDKYRPAYGRHVENHPRTCIIVGTTNGERGFLRDVTGNRRFWPVAVKGGGKTPPWTLPAETVNQIWAEAAAAFKAGEDLYLTDKTLLADAEKQQREAMEIDDREGVVAEYLNRLLPDDWKNMNTYKRRDFLESEKEGCVKRDTVCAVEIWCECFNKNKEDIRKADSHDINAILRRLGWAADNVIRTKMYGTQRMFSLAKEEAEDELLT